jgi:hypothetical protein
VRAGRVGERSALETYHDRIRETVTSRLDDQRRAELHAQLADAMRALEHADPEALLGHLLGADDREGALEQAERAGDRAVAALAFDRAARFYETALGLVLSSPARTRALAWKLGDALANAGRGADAASSYLRAVDGSPAGDVLELKRRAAEQLLRSGHFGAGLDAVREVLSAVEIRFPQTPLGVLAALLWNMLLVRLRGRRWVSRDESQVSQEEIRRIDVCWSVNATLSLADPIRALAFQKQHVLRALSAGEPYRVCRALATESVASALRGPAHWQETDAVHESALRIAEKVENPRGRAIALFTAGMARYLDGRTRRSREVLDRAIVHLRDECTGVAWELATSEVFYTWCLWRLGDLRDLVRRVSLLLQEANERGDLGLAVNLRVGLANAVWLIEDDPDRAVAEVSAAIGRLGAHVAPLVAYYETMALVNVDLYRGEGARAVARIVERLAFFRRARIFRVQNVHVEYLHFHARAVLARAEREADPSSAHRDAARAARLLRRSGVPWARAASRLLRAAMHARVGERDAAVAELCGARAGFEAEEMKAYVAACNARLAELVEGAEAETAHAAAFGYLREQQVKRPERLIALLAPGFSSAATPRHARRNDVAPEAG